jgi:hypothetical protein
VCEVIDFGASPDLLLLEQLAPLSIGAESYLFAEFISVLG